MARRKRKIDYLWFLVLSDLFVNLSAGWFGAAFIIPVFSDKPISVNLGILTTDIVLGIVFLILAFRLKKFGGKI